MGGGLFWRGVGVGGGTVPGAAQADAVRQRAAAREAELERAVERATERAAEAQREAGRLRGLLETMAVEGEDRRAALEEALAAERKRCAFCSARRCANPPWAGLRAARLRVQPVGGVAAGQPSGCGWVSGDAARYVAIATLLSLPSWRWL